MPSPVTIVASIILMAGFFGLAVLGWGGLGPFFEDPARVAVTIVGVIFAIAAGFTHGSLSSGEREDRANRWVIAAFTVVGLAAAYVPAYNDRIGFWTIDGNFVRWVGVVLFALGSALRIWPVFVLGHRFSGLVAIQPGHTLVTTGIYGVIRHPSYLGLIVSTLGWVLVFRSLVGVLLTGLTIVPLIARIRSEEALLAAQFGAEYEAYRRRTARLLPGIY
ncbi:MAG: isoprenylcysteine carboxyl methyltransferase [Proteobacteria bacterium]|nr:MAG: isoprenylcysteine carboxyl methyltransferase [Pseudomonadota bacterium]